MGDVNQPGIIPRAIEYIFNTLPKLPLEPRVKSRQSGREIYLLSENEPINQAVMINSLISDTAGSNHYNQIYL